MNLGARTLPMVRAAAVPAARAQLSPFRPAAHARLACGIIGSGFLG